MSISMPRRPSVPGPPRFRLGEARLERLEGAVDDLHLAAGAVEQPDKVVDDVAFFKLVGNVLVHGAAGSQEVVLRLDQYNGRFRGNNRHDDSPMFE
ncbi:MAG: hypothetical protein NVV74_24990 [Magnetospirillum sp.]|nr:hypothetical protein [Magnetospirillum sp.]